MMRSLFSAVSGLKTHQTKMDVIGNNVSNVNTVAFKSSSVTFSEIMYQTTSNASGANAATGKGGVNAKQIGLGVSMGSTKISITGAGAAETTGDGLDLRLTDKVSTNFFIVSDGTKNLFTRAGSFYIDGAGNLAMTSTGYTVMGWQVDETTGDIKKDTVSALRVMEEKNLTSPAEATSLGTVAGIIDRNDTNVSSDDGYTMVLNFYDNLGYSYSAKFAVKLTDAKTETYSVELSDILDSENKSILSEYLQKNPTADLSSLFGRQTTATKSYMPTNSNIKYYPNGPTDDVNGNTEPGYYYEYATFQQQPNGTVIPAKGYAKVNTWIDQDGNDGGLMYQISNYKYFVDKESCSKGIEADKPASEIESMADFFGISQLQLSAYDDTVTPDTVDGAARPVAYMDPDTGAFVYVEDTINHTLKFSPDDGTFSYVGMQGSNTVTLNLADTLGNNFSDIKIDFSGCKSSDNGGKSTANADAGFRNEGTGRALGAMIGLNINNNGRIYGTYDNGNTVLLGQIAVAQFANASGLEKVGENCYTTTLNSGDFDGVGREIAADGSSMTSGELEMSNVDLSTEFTQMIITQRGFQSNSRVITTSDTLLEELINLKR